GMITSVKAALPFVKTEKFFIALSDMPIIQPEIFKRMSVMDFPDVLFPVYRGERGHPVLISSSLIDIIMKAPDSVRMKDVLNKVDISEIEIENNCILFDIDTKNDYKKLQSL
ncbi:MAG: NTP transferase domain-containing protein, partial [Deltaproteobacteria bacterium]|nr:NTP transferase domain-containing protein [Deltaproteobacteria bacterium]